MTPTIGRIVHFITAGGRTRPAIVSEVHTDTCITLHVMFTPWDDEREPGCRPVVACVTSVNLDASDTPANGTWHWMAYQIGQAAAVDALQAQLNAKPNPAP